MRGKVLAVLAMFFSTPVLAQAHINDFAARVAASRGGSHRLDPGAFSGAWNLRYYNSPCRNIEVIFFYASKHPGGDRNGRLEENNRGVAIRCAGEQGGETSFLVGGLKNSQFGSAFVSGFGYNPRTPELGIRGLRAYGGVDLLYLVYEWPSRQKTIVGALDVRNLGLTYELPRDWGTLSYNRGWLSSTGIHLDSVVWRVPTRFLQ